MKKAKNNQTIDCVALKRQAQTKIYADTKGLSVTDQIDYFRRRAETGALGRWWKQIAKLPVEASPLVVREKPAKYGKRSQ